MKTPKLRYHLVNYNNRILFKILEMDERFRRNNEYSGYKQFLASNGWSIYSTIGPWLSYEDKSIYLQGMESEKDNRIVITKTPSEPEAKRIIAEIHFALKEWAEKWEGWEEGLEKSMENVIILEEYIV